MTLSFFKHYAILILITIYFPRPSTAWWPFSSPSKETQEEPIDKVDKLEQSVDVRLVPFEVKNAEDRFVKEAESYITLSRLDYCNLRVWITKSS